MKYFKIIIFLFVIMLCGSIHKTYALDVIKTSDTYSTIPFNYHFAPRFISNKTYIELCNAPKGMKWNVENGYYQLQNKSNKAVMPDHTYKGSIYIIYHQVGYYNEQAVDMKITITDWNNQCKRIEFGKNYIGFGNASGSSGGLNSYISAKIEYFYAGTNQLFSKLKGHQPVGDLDCFNDSNQSEWIKLLNNCSSSIIIPHSSYDGFNLSRISNNMIGTLRGNGGTSNTDGLDFVYLFESPSHTITWYGGFLRMNMTCPDAEFQINYYKGNALGNMNSQIVNYGVKTKLNAQSFYKEGYSFNGWHVYRDYDDSWACINGNTWKSGSYQCHDLLHYKDQAVVSKTAPCGNVYMYACFKENTYFINFDSNGGIGYMDQQTFLYDQSQVLEKNSFKKEGYSFIGWSLKKDGDISFKDQQTVSNLSAINGQVITLYAKWEKQSYKNTITHLFYDKNDQLINGGQTQFDAYFNEKFNLNDYLLQIPNGYEVNKYFDSGSIDHQWESYDINQSILQKNHNMAFYIYYTPSHYTITYQLNGGDNHKDNPLIYSVLDQIQLLSPYKKGCDFKGWYLNNQLVTGINISQNTSYSSYQELLNGLSNCITGNLIIEAKWESIPIINAKTNYYYINDDVSIEEVLNNASARDVIDGDLTSKIKIKEIIYPSYTAYNPTYLDTSSLGIVYVKYNVTNSSLITSEETGVIYIVDHKQNTSFDHLIIYPRFINNEVCSDGVNSIDTLDDYSIWLYDEYFSLLQDSLNRDGNDYLHEYDYINEEI